MILSGVLGGGTIAATQTAGETVDGAASQGTATSDAATIQTNSQLRTRGQPPFHPGKVRRFRQFPQKPPRLLATGNVREGDLTLLDVLTLLGGSVLGIKAFWKRN